MVHIMQAVYKVEKFTIRYDKEWNDNFEYLIRFKTIINGIPCQVNVSDVPIDHKLTMDLINLAYELTSINATSLSFCVDVDAPLSSEPIKNGKYCGIYLSNGDAL